MGHRHPIPIELQKNDCASLDVIVKDVARRIEELQRTIVMAINGSSIDVGKSAVSSTLNGMLMLRGVPVGMTSDLHGYTLAEEDLTRSQHALHTDVPGVLLFGAAMIDGSTRTLRQLATLRSLLNGVLRGSGGPRAVDVWIGVRRPDKPFSRRHPLADYLIDNLGAADKRGFT